MTQQRLLVGWLALALAFAAAAPPPLQDSDVVIAQSDGDSARSPGRGGLPPFYLQHRTHAHTRFAPQEFCNNATGAWQCTPAFENAFAALASLGVPVFVRQTHSRDEGTWWPSKSGPRASWAPMVQATGRNLPAEFLAAAKNAGIHVIFYHFMCGSNYWAAAKPEWVARWPNLNGSAIVSKQAPNGITSTCAQPWREVYIAHIKELIALGGRAFFFDHYPGNPGGDWSESCQQEFQRRFGKPMPTGLVTAGARPAPAGGPIQRHRGARV